MILNDLIPNDLILNERENMKMSWNPDTDGLPQERYRTYKNHRVATFSDEGGYKWKYSIDNVESEDWFPERIDAENAVFAKLDSDEYYKDEKI